MEMIEVTSKLKEAEVVRKEQEQPGDGDD